MFRNATQAFVAGASRNAPLGTTQKTPDYALIEALSAFGDAKEKDMNIKQGEKKDFRRYIEEKSQAINPASCVW